MLVSQKNLQLTSACSRWCFKPKGWWSNRVASVPCTASHIAEKHRALVLFGSTSCATNPSTGEPKHVQTKTVLDVICIYTYVYHLYIYNGLCIYTYINISIDKCFRYDSTRTSLVKILGVKDPIENVSEAIVIRGFWSQDGPRSTRYLSAMPWSCKHADHHFA